MLAKFILSSTIIASTAIIGYIMAHRYTQRLNELKNLFISFQLLETEIMYSSNNLPRALQKVGQKSGKTVKSIFLDTYEVLKDRSGLSIEEAWSKALDNNISKTALNNEDKDILLDFGFNLGSTDKENQIKNFQFIYLQLKSHLENAEILRLKNEKMCKSLGVLIGLTIVIVFI